MTPQEALHLVLQQAQTCRHPDPVYDGEWECGDLLVRLEALGYTVARTQDAADGEALRLLREALPDWWVTVTFTYGRGVKVLAEPPVGMAPPARYPSGHGDTIAEAADDCREALPGRG